MRKVITILLITLNCLLSQISKDSNTIVLPLNSDSDLELINVKTNIVVHKGKKGLQVSKKDGEIKDGTLVIISGINFKNGTIELELTGEPAKDAAPQMRGFVGVAFRVNPENYSSYECFYIRPTNARANNQLRRNHTSQYISHPEYPWHQLRKENPGLYESYVDLVPGEWVKVKIEVDGSSAKFYLHDNNQPNLIVNDLKHKESEGLIALWLHSSTLAHYRNLVITKK